MTSILDRHAEVDRLLWATAIRMLRHDRGDLRADLVQEAWVRLLQEPPFDPDRGVRWSTWITQRARWAMQDALRRQYPRGSRRQWEQVSAEHLAPLEAPEHRDDPILRRVIGRWAGSQSETAKRTMASLLAGERPVDVAVVEGVSATAISQRRTAVRMRFRNYLQSRSCRVAA